MPATLKIGSRPSKLALTQAEYVRNRLASVLLDAVIEIVEIKTSGDRMKDASLAQVGGKGLFIKELEQALSARRIDIAVHSMKDLPAILAPEFRIASVPGREDPRDALVARSGTSLAAMPPGSRVGTSSPRRQLQALRVNPSLSISPLRGNVDTRLKRVVDGDLDGIIIAMAGLKRLGRTEINLAALDEIDFIPAGGQGILAIEALNDGSAGGSHECEAALSAISDPRVQFEATAERAFLATIGASCVTPVGVKASAANGNFTIRSILFSNDGSRELSESFEEPLDPDLAMSRAYLAGQNLAERMLARGARALISEGSPG
ncbi:MAG TPA: hydroxymethylbilane synthase [Candidatus Binataceae bacterium]